MRIDRLQSSWRAGDRAARSRAASVHCELDLESIGRVVAGQLSPKALDALRRRADVPYVEPDDEVLAFDQSFRGERPPCCRSAHANGDTGNGADVAIMDTGIDSDHPDIEAVIGNGYAVDV